MNTLEVGALGVLSRQFLPRLYALSSRFLPSLRSRYIPFPFPSTTVLVSYPVLPFVFGFPFISPF
ncbi:hypothetical protein FIBSPDRAFT_860261 [Athelia psychrophila]|uniref:Uncharacterized protein n=1 Tax=Athelia psychrophila TaxID=1759441 RepID=A0A166KGP0_9AGAM|nr:hypothetical protein FIBSPDRAFT_860261 [Fibularhizoctonia sp. CBS 109695]